MDRQLKWQYKFGYQTADYILQGYSILQNPHKNKDFADKTSYMVFCVDTRDVLLFFFFHILLLYCYSSDLHQ